MIRIRTEKLKKSVKITEFDRIRRRSLIEVWYFVSLEIFGSWPGHQIGAILIGAVLIINMIFLWLTFKWYHWHQLIVSEIGLSQITESITFIVRSITELHVLTMKTEFSINSATRLSWSVIVSEISFLFFEFFNKNWIFSNFKIPSVNESFPSVNYCVLIRATSEIFFGPFFDITNDVSHPMSRVVCNSELATWSSFSGFGRILLFFFDLTIGLIHVLVTASARYQILAGTLSAVTSLQLSDFTLKSSATAAPSTVEFRPKVLFMHPKELLS